MLAGSVAGFRAIPPGGLVRHTIALVGLVAIVILAVTLLTANFTLGIAQLRRAGVGFKLAVFFAILYGAALGGLTLSLLNAALPR